MKNKMFNKLLPIAIVIGALIIAGALIYIKLGKSAISSQVAGEKAVNYINQVIYQGQGDAKLIEATDDGQVFKIRLTVQGQEYTSYVTKDGRYLFPQAYELGTSTESNNNEENGEITKTDKPDVKIFVMSYCPYGLQAQKMLLPVQNLLKDKAQMGIYFVNYIMHGKQEIDENLRQYCIQKEQNDKYFNYLSCFVKDGKSDTCLTQAQIDQEKLSQCVSETDSKYKVTQMYNDKNTWLNGNYPKFDVNTDLNEEYGVQGSPTIVINDKEVSVSQRTPEAFKNIVCQYFNNPPEECSQTLSSAAPSAGFGEGTNDSSGGGSCE